MFNGFVWRFFSCFFNITNISIKWIQCNFRWIDKFHYISFKPFQRFLILNFTIKKFIKFHQLFLSTSIFLNLFIWQISRTFINTICKQHKTTIIRCIFTVRYNHCFVYSIIRFIIKQCSVNYLKSTKSCSEIIWKVWRKCDVFNTIIIIWNLNCINSIIIFSIFSNIFIKYYLFNCFMIFNILFFSNKSFPMWRYDCRFSKFIR